MKKEKIKNILLIVIVALVTSFVTAYGVSSTFDSSNVCYKVDSNTGASVQDTIDDLYGRASDYSELNTELSTLKTKVGTNALNTTSTDLSSAINEVNNISLKIKKFSLNISSTSNGSNNWGYWGSAGLDISPLNKSSIKGIYIEKCSLTSDYNILGMCDFTGAFIDGKPLFSVNSKVSGTFNLNILILYQ